MVARSLLLLQYVTHRVLLIDDDAALLEALSMAFEGAGYATDCARDGQEGLGRIAGEPDVIVSDINMPGVDGFALCRRLRAQGCWIPIVLLTTRTGDIDEALGLELGADDYVSKPFSMQVLLARVASLIRREEARKQERAATPTVVGDLVLDPDRLEVCYRGQRIHVTVTEFRLLDALCMRPGRVLSRAQLLERARSDDSYVAVRIVDTYVARLRRKLSVIDPEFDRIETVIGAGYRWKDRP